MSVILNLREFDDDLALKGYHTRQVWAGSVRQLIGGGVVDQQVAVQIGQEIMISADLDGGDLYGEFSLDDRDFLLALKASRATVAFEYHDGISLLVCVTEVDLEPLLGEVDPDEDSLFYGDVTLLIKGV